MEPYELGIGLGLMVLILWALHNGAPGNDKRGGFLIAVVLTIALFFFVMQWVLIVDWIKLHVFK